MSKMMAIVIVAVMTMMYAIPMSVFAAAGDPKVSMEIASTDTHEYKVYQIYTGVLDGDTLSNVKYGNSGYGTAGQSVPKDELDGITDADTFARSIADQCTTPVGTLTKDNNSISTLADGTTPLPAGYYLIVDDTSKALTDGDAYSAYIVEVLKETTVSPKKDTTISDKIITTDTLGIDDDTTSVNGKVDNVSIGDTVNYQITGTIPTTATDYNYFFYIIGDTLTEGLTFDPSSVVVTVNVDANEDEKDDTLAENTDYQLYVADASDTGSAYKTADSGKTFQVALLDAKSLAGKTVTVTYSATLNENANIGEFSNDNTVVIDYSNNPNYDYDGDKDEENPGKPEPNEENPTPLGHTPESKTNTFTTGIQIQKVDEEGNVLTGAEFTVTGDNQEIVLVSSESFAPSDEGTYYKLTNNTYTTEPPVTADYMKETPGATKGYVVDSTYDGEGKVVINNITYRPYNSETDTQAIVYTLIKANAGNYDSTSQKYAKTVTFTQKDTNSEGVTASASVGPDGVVTFNGLGAGTYTIEETQTPAGYNTVDPITFTISFTANPQDGSYHWSTTSEDATYNPTTGEFELTIENQKGTELPSTGGIGTTLFYLIGTILVLGAGVLMVTRRRMKKFEQ